MRQVPRAAVAGPELVRPLAAAWDFRPLAVMLTAGLMGVEQSRRSTCSSTQKVSLGKTSDFEESSMKEVKLEGGSAVLLGSSPGIFLGLLVW